MNIMIAYIMPTASGCHECWRYSHKAVVSAFAGRRHGEISTRAKHADTTVYSVTEASKKEGSRQKRWHEIRCVYEDKWAADYSV